MKKLRAVAVFFVVFASGELWACGHDPGPSYNAVGLPCRSDVDCGGLYCTDVGGGTCQFACRSNADCGPGATCDSRNRHGTGGKVDVCVPH